MATPGPMALGVGPVGAAVVVLLLRRSVGVGVGLLVEGVGAVAEGVVDLQQRVRQEAVEALRVMQVKVVRREVKAGRRRARKAVCDRLIRCPSVSARPSCLSF